MRNAKTSHAEAVVLKTMDYGEADKIITLFTKEFGKVHAVAKGVRRSTSKMGGHLDLFAHSSILLVHGRNLDTVTQGQGINTHGHLREDLTALASACYIAELVDRFTEDESPSSELYRLLVQTLGNLAATDRSMLAVALFQLQLLAVSGYRPQLRRCVVCNKDIAPGKNGFDSELGGVLCPSCCESHSGAFMLSTNALKVLRNLQVRGEELFGVDVTEEIVTEVNSVLAQYTQYVLERRPNSANFLDRVQRDDQTAGRAI